MRQSKESQFSGLEVNEVRNDASSASWIFRGNMGLLVGLTEKGRRAWHRHAAGQGMTGLGMRRGEVSISTASRLELRMPRSRI